MRLLLLLAFSLSYLAGFGQNSDSTRIILIGDAGEMTPGQIEALRYASQKVRPQKTTVFFLGDNIYPHGIGLTGQPDADTTREVLRSQFKPMLAQKARVYFVPGNHDWTRSQKVGLDKIKQAGQFLSDQHESDLKMVPSRYGCPDPEAIKITDSITVIAYDSQWWLLRDRTDSAYIHCECKTNDAVINRMKALRDENKGKVIILASHHPFQSYGNHGSKFAPIFYIIPPLQLYPLLRPRLLRQDLKHAKYKDMRNKITQVFENTPGVIYAAGHEHGLQLIHDGKHTQIVSGAGAKRNYIKRSKAPQVFADNSQGFVVMDLIRSERNVNISYVYYDLATKSWSEKKWRLRYSGQLDAN